MDRIKSRFQREGGTYIINVGCVWVGGMVCGLDGLTALAVSVVTMTTLHLMGE